MATKRMSPTASLLRHSRLFSLPPPLPPPSQRTSTSISIFQSDTATLPYPIHASIETTQSSLARGDWGLKRALPQQSTTTTTTPVIRIGAIDTIDHITDFNSAADHTLTLRKWQEMNMPVSMPPIRKSLSNSEPVISTFEEHLNRTDAQGATSSEDSRRWKYRGPWLAGQTQGEFEDYITTRITRKRTEFRKYVRNWLRQKKTAVARRDAIDRGEDLPSTDVKISEDDLQTEIIKLRSDPATLWALIWQFLDLPDSPPRLSEHTSEKLLRENGYTGADQASKDIEQGPPTTHPSAGLSYLRTASHVPNHPILGPMSTKQPVIGRILKHPLPASNKQRGALVGVGGVVAQDVDIQVFSNLRDKEWAQFDPNLEGGAKGWTHPQIASIDPRGRIKLTVRRASDNTIALWEGLVAPEIAEAEAAARVGNGAKLTKPGRAANRLFGPHQEPRPTRVFHDPDTRRDLTVKELRDDMIKIGFPRTFVG